MKKRIEYKTSRTAEMTCSIRASSFYETEPCLKTDDYISPRLLPKALLPLVRSRRLRSFFRNLIAPAGVYEYVIARTRYCDTVVRKALDEGFTQVVLPGAGFDSRAIRFSRQGSEATFFELDTETTQNAKRAQLRKRKIAVPGSIVYIPIDFSKESMENKLMEHGFKRTEKTLFLLEGITMYLEEEAVRDTFAVIRSLSASRSLVVFDFIYRSVLRKEGTLYGEEALVGRTSRYNEAWRFGIEAGRVEAFVEGLGFKLLGSASPEDLEKEYGFGSHRINGTHCIALAGVP